MEAVDTSFKNLMECYLEMSYLFMKLFLPGSGPLHTQEAPLRTQDRPMAQSEIPSQLQAEYSLLHLQAGATLAETRAQYRELAKLYHPDAGGQHAYFLVLQQAYERVVEYLQTQCG